MMYATKQPLAATTQSFFFLLCAVIPWVSPVIGGAMVPGIPLLVGWICTALLFFHFPAYKGRALAVYVGLFTTVAALGSVLFNTEWQTFVVALSMIGAAAAVGAHCAQISQDQVAPAESSALWAGIRLIAWSWLIAGLINAFIGFLQAMQWADHFTPFVNTTSVGNIYGNVRQRNQYASLMHIAVWALWYLWASGGLARNAVRWGGKVWAFVLLVPLIFAMALTLSRTGLLQLGILVVLLLWWGLHQSEDKSALRWGLLWLVAALVVYALTSWYAPHLFGGGADIVGRLDGSDTRQCVSRTVLWGNVWHLIMQKPLTGWGWGELTLQHYAANFEPNTRFCLMLDNAHNLPLHLAFAFGLPATALVGAVVLWWVLRNRPWQEAMLERQLMWGVLAVIMLHSMVEYPLWYSSFMLAFGLALGALWALPRPQQTLADSDSVPVAQWLLGQRVIAVVMLVGLFYASFDFVRVTQLYTDPQDRVWPFKTNTEAQAKRTILYQNAVNFASLSTVPVTPANAQTQLEVARQLMVYSPEARVIERVITCLHLLNRHAEAEKEESHFASVYPKEYADWKKTQSSADDVEQLQ